MRNIPEIKLYGTDGCHKTHYYQLLLNDTGLPYHFLDVEKNENYARELRSLYESGELNFLTITIGTKKLRNPYKEESKTTEESPKGICPNCWGKQEWEGHYYNFMKGNNGNPSTETYNTFIKGVARKLDKIELDKNTYTCELVMYNINS